MVCELKMRSPQLFVNWRFRSNTRCPDQCLGQGRTAVGSPARQWKLEPGSWVTENEAIRSS